MLNGVFLQKTLLCYGLSGQTDLCASLIVLCITCMNLAKLLNFTESQGIIMHDLQNCYEDYVLNSKKFVWAMKIT